MNGNISSILDEIIKEIEANDFSYTRNVVLLPPSNYPFASDEKEGDPAGTRHLQDILGLSWNCLVSIRHS